MKEVTLHDLLINKEEKLLPSIEINAQEAIIHAVGNRDKEKFISLENSNEDK